MIYIISFIKHYILESKLCYYLSFAQRPSRSNNHLDVKVTVLDLKKKSKKERKKIIVFYLFPLHKEGKAPLVLSSNNMEVIS